MGLRTLWGALILCAGVAAIGVPQASAAPAGTVILVVPPGATTPAVPHDYLVDTLGAAKQLVAQHNSSGNVTVELASGTYSITQPLTFGPADGGQNGSHVTWTAAPGAKPVISGGEQVSNWTLYDAASNIWEANVGVGTTTRNLYVNGRDAPIAGSPRGGSPAVPSADLSPTSAGFTINNSTLQSTLDALPEGQIQIEHRGLWSDHYCPVSSISGSVITMAQPCWENNTMGYDTGDSPYGNYIEGSLAYLNQPNEWYLDSETGTLYYEPPAGTSISSLDIELPLVQSLLDVSGSSYSNRVQNLTFTGIQFSNSSWLAPSSPSGYADQQQNYFIAGVNPAGYPTFGSCPWGCSQFEAVRGRWNEVPGAVQVSAANGITFANDNFTDLGSAGLGIGEDADAMASGIAYGAQNITVANNTFRQIGGTGVMIGGIQFPAAWDQSNGLATTKNIVVENNVITATGTSYLDSDGVQTNNTTHAVITHNKIYDIPYDGIGLGFGWGMFDPGGSEDYAQRGTYNYYPIPTTFSPQEYGSTTDNLIYGTGRGTPTFSCCAGPFYNLSAAPFSVVSANYMYGNNPFQGGLYGDEGTRFNTFYGNVIQDASSWAGINSSPTNNSGDNLFQSNWFNNSATVNSTTGVGDPHYNVLFANQSVTGTDWPTAATAVINNAGLSAGLGYPDPSITTMDQATMAVGSSGNFTVYASGSPTPHFEVAGRLPGGVRFTDNGDGTASIAGRPTPGSAGTYALSIVASNGPGERTVQSFTLTVLAKSPTATTEDVTGRVTDAATGRPLADVCVSLYANPTATTPLASARTSPDGSYEMDGVVPGPLQALDTYHYLVGFSEPSNPGQTVWYNGTPAGAPTEADANAIQLEGRLGTAVTGIDGALPSTDSAAQPLPQGSCPSGSGS